MNKLAYLVVASVLACYSVGYAGSGCCGLSMSASAETGEKKLGNVPSPATCKAVCDKLDINEDQKAKVAEIIAACPAEGCKAEDMEKCMKLLGDVLTPEQMTQFKSECQKACGTACPAKQ